jgi:hypothetical protein
MSSSTTNNEDNFTRVSITIAVLQFLSRLTILSHNRNISQQYNNNNNNNESYNKLCYTSFIGIIITTK